MKTSLKIAAILIASGSLAACGTSNATKGAAIGAVGGGVVGSAVTGGNPIGTAAGAIGGGVIGHEIGENRDKRQGR